MNHGLYASSLDNFCFIVYNTTFKIYGFSIMIIIDLLIIGGFIGIGVCIAFLIVNDVRKSLKVKKHIDNQQKKEKIDLESRLVDHNLLVRVSLINKEQRIQKVTIHECFLFRPSHTEVCKATCR